MRPFEGRDCTVCGEPIDDKQGSARFCGGSCRSRAHHGTVARQCWAPGCTAPPVMGRGLKYCERHSSSCWVEGCTETLRVGANGHVAVGCPVHGRVVRQATRHGGLDLSLLLTLTALGCALCRRTDVELNVDHWHGCHSGIYGCPACVRGLLCQECNTSLVQGADFFVDTFGAGSAQVLRAITPHLLTYLLQRPFAAPDEKRTV